MFTLIIIMKFSHQYSISTPSSQAALSLLIVTLVCNQDVWGGLAYMAAWWFFHL